jgi:hypothetical protein
MELLSKSAWQKRVAAHAALKTLAHEVIAASRNHRHLVVLRRAFSGVLAPLGKPRKTSARSNAVTQVAEELPLT